MCQNKVELFYHTSRVLTRMTAMICTIFRIVISIYLLISGPSNDKERDQIHFRTTRQMTKCEGLGPKTSKAIKFFLYEQYNRPVLQRKIHFYFSSRLSPRARVGLENKFNVGEELNFKIQRRTVIIIHGFLSHGRQNWIRRMENAFLAWNDVNIITVDWSAIGDSWNYYNAAIHTKTVGDAIVKMLTNIVALFNNSTWTDLNWGPIHMIGHSLGSHICNVVARQFSKIQTPWKIRRLTALDPAQPCFLPKMYKSREMFVDVIHTNGRELINLGLGLPQPLGDMDFYPNGGMLQLGCVPRQPPARNIFQSIAIFFKNSIQAAICSHSRAQEYFTESLVEAHYKNGSFLGKPWDGSYLGTLKLMCTNCTKNQCPEMGINAENYKQRGCFFVETSPSAPYSAVTST